MAILSDLRQAVRVWGRRPGFTVLAVLTLAVGVAVTTVTFSLADWLMLRPVPGIANPGRLTLVEFGTPHRPVGVSYPNFADLRAATPAFSAFGGWARIPLQVAPAHGAPAQVQGELVVGDYFGALGVQPELGRFFAPSELKPGGNTRVAVISHRLRTADFGDSISPLGSRLTVNGNAFTVIGVAPAAFRGPGRTSSTDVWLPAPAYVVAHNMAGLKLDDRRATVFSFAIGRLRNGATPALARQQLHATMARLERRYPRSNAIYEKKLPSVYGDFWLNPLLKPFVGRTLRLLMGIALLVMLVACTNVANLLLFRGVHRRGEMAVRRALGASAGRVLRQHLAEGLVLALAAVGAGLILAVWLGELLKGRRLMPWLLPVVTLPVDGRVLGFALAAAVATALLASLAPGLLAPRQRLLTGLKEAAPTETHGKVRLRAGFTVVQIATAVTLLIGALLLTGTVRALSRVRLGFDADSVTAYGLNLQPQGYTRAEAAALYRRFARRVAALPGVERVALTSATPFPGSPMMEQLAASPAALSTTPPMNVYYVAGDYFRTLGIPLEEGTGFQHGTADLPTVGARPSASQGIVLSHAAARQLFGATDPLGRTLIRRTVHGNVSASVIGLVPDTRSRSPGAPYGPIVYEPLARAPLFMASNAELVVRSATPAVRLDRAVRRVAGEIAPDIPLVETGTLAQAARESIAQQRLLANVAALLALLSALLAGVGLYGVVAYSVARRTHEIGIRIALGADRGDLTGLVARQVLWLLLVGLPAGWVGGAVFARELRSRLFGLHPLDPRVYLAAAVVFGVVALAAALLPARRATRISPLTSMRAE